HSGGYGGTVENPAHALAGIIASFHDADHRVAVPGVYNEVETVSDEERATLAQLPFDTEGYRQSVGVPVLVGEGCYSPLEQRWIRPTLDVNGIWGGWTVDGPKTIIPASTAGRVGWARATATGGAWRPGAMSSSTDGRSGTGCGSRPTRIGGSAGASRERERSAAARSGPREPCRARG